MRSNRHSVIRALTTITASMLASAASVRADLNYPTFPNTAGLTVVGNTAATGGLLRLTPSVGFQAGAAWGAAQQTAGAGFRTTFTFRITDPQGGGADGFAFVIQNAAANAIGDDGCGIGYNSMPKSLAVEFDTYQGNCGSGNGADPNNNHISVHTLGIQPNSATESASIGSNSSLPNFRDGAIHTARIDYIPGEISVYLDDLTTPIIAASVNLSSSLALTGNLAWVGFTAATGGATENHDILS